MLKSKLLLIIIYFCILSVAKSQTTQEIYHKYIEAIGGEDAIKSINSIQLNGILQTLNSPPEKTIVYRKRKELYRKETYRDTVMYSCDCYDGKYFWRLWENSANPKNVTSSQNTNKAWTIDDDAGGMSLFNELIEFQHYGSRIHKQEEVEENNKEYNVIRLTRRNLSMVDFYINKSTYLVDKTVEINSDDESRSYTLIDEYKKIGNLLIPHRSKMYMMGYLFSTTVYNKILLNPILTDSLFKCEKEKKSTF